METHFEIIVETSTKQHFRNLPLFLITTWKWRYLSSCICQSIIYLCKTCNRILKLFQSYLFSSTDTDKIRTYRVSNKVSCSVFTTTLKISHKFPPNLAWGLRMSDNVMQAFYHVINQSIKYQSIDRLIQTMKIHKQQ